MSRRQRGYWLVLQMAAVLLGVLAGVRLFDIVAR